MTNLLHALSRRTMLAAIPLVPLAAKAATIPDRSGMLSVPGGKVWWRRLGDGPKPPLVLLHGGPGMGHDYLLPLGSLAQGREIIFYDQLGCGRSDAPEEPQLYTIEQFATRLEVLREALKLPRIVLYGHSWGGILAIEYLASRKRLGVERLILSNALASARQANDGIFGLMSKMPGGERLVTLERGRDYGSPEYTTLANAFSDLHQCRADPKPPELEASIANAMQSPCVSIMAGGGITITGNLKNWDRRARLASFDMPTLIVTGEFDEIARDCHETMRDAIPGARLAVMPGCSHLLMSEAPVAYNTLLRNFIG
ncbi:MAG TPA: proline iminopeptidase-family hydrolase [Rhizomicrobium sp.]|jgi:proline iminopeptidase